MESQYAKYVDSDVNDAVNNNGTVTESPNPETTTPSWITWAPDIQIEDPSGRWIGNDEPAVDDTDGQLDDTEDDGWVVWRPEEDTEE